MLAKEKTLLKLALSSLPVFSKDKLHEYIAAK
jgi:hypothetical protein